LDLQALINKIKSLAQFVKFHYSKIITKIYILFNLLIIKIKSGINIFIALINKIRMNKYILFLAAKIKIFINKIKSNRFIIFLFGKLRFLKEKISSIKFPDYSWKNVPGESSRWISPTMFKYILSEMLFSFIICFCFFFFIFFVNQILLMAKEVLTKHVPFNQVALLILFSLPTVIAMSAPFASLVGTLMTVGRMTSDNEILVMLSSGLSYKNIFFPAIAVGVLVSILSFFTNDVLLPAGTVQFNKLWKKIAVSTPALELQENSVKRFRNTIIVSGGVDGNAVKNVLILDKTNDGERRIILASRAELKDGGRQGLSLDLEDAFISSSKEVVREDYDYASSEILRYWVSNEDIIPAAASISPREMSSRDVSNAIKIKRVDVAQRENERKLKFCAFASSTENTLRRGPDYPDWNRRTTTISGFTREKYAIESIIKDRSLNIHVIEIYRKFAVPFGAFFFVFLAVSLGLMAKKSGQTVGFIFGNLIAVMYWAMLFIGQASGIRLNAPPFWAMWLPNIICLVVGVILALVKVRR